MTETLSMRERIARDAEAVREKLDLTVIAEERLDSAPAGWLDRDEAVAILSTALSEAYAAGRAAGVEEAAKEIDPILPCGPSDYDKQAFDLRDVLAYRVRALIPRPADDTPASPA